MTEDKSSTSQSVVETINAPRLSPPSMADTNIETYFMSLEFWFAASGIGTHSQHDSRKYNIVMAQVPPNKLTELRSIIEATPANDKYTYIKHKLIEYFADSQQRRLQRVLSDMPLGDLKPSQLFNEMKRVAGNSLGEPVLLDLWASRLPPHAQAAVIASRGDATDKITIADAIVDSMVLRKINAIDYSVQNTAMAAPNVLESTCNDPMQDLKREIAELSRKFEKVLLSQKNFRGRSRSRSRVNEKQSTRGREPSIGLCWYHRTFGNDARRCRKPCSNGQQVCSNSQ
ncbi:uncharacterized protein LOC129774202 [Toxorhynchites rutilus septentrionalis]|uniref:uncharacterized protein LOC129774202 n=1 Tax=Toxorhynchites rutilus septentrionalis TaxID=329112 RepID=UPI0024787D6B|nr:uncharacterized protein LOC129774202 [Toxorhynchites rutilus septentrionalis]